MKDKTNHVVKSMSKELQLLLELLKQPIHSESRVGLKKGEYHDIDWDHFIELALHHRVYSFIYPKLKEKGWDVIPTHVIQKFYHRFKENTVQMLRLSAEMIRLKELFDQNEIRNLFLKGPILAQELYGDISLRTSCDLDVLVPIQCLEVAEMLLLELGYVKNDYIESVLNDWKWRHHHITFFHPAKQIKVEIHWRLHPGPRKEPTFEELWKRKQEILLTNYSIYTLGCEDLFVFLVSHGARHGWSRLRWLVDISQIVKQNLNWNKIEKLMLKYQVLHLGGQALILMSLLLEMNLNNEMRGLIVSRRSEELANATRFYTNQTINLHADTLPKEVIVYHRQYLLALMSKRQKMLFVMSCLYPYPIDAKTLPLPKFLHFLYFPLRPFLCCWRKIKKSDAS
ncbi:nucleotidyltransferase family protein [Bacillus pacificus]|uniref:nucleotidyltransferase domain-containing protein n=1 Tax=Bacillus pacificus TaxID=2026187 RepID=UPI003D25AD62